MPLEETYMDYTAMSRFERILLQYLFSRNGANSVLMIINLLLDYEKSGYLQGKEEEWSDGLHMALKRFQECEIIRVGTDQRVTITQKGATVIEEFLRWLATGGDEELLVALRGLDSGTIRTDASKKIDDVME